MLLDSNIIIYAARPEHTALRNFIEANSPSVSAVSYVEVLGFHKLTPDDRQKLEQFFAAARVLPIDQAVLDGAVSLRQQRRMALGDSLVAATAAVHKLTLATHNTSDFGWIPGIKLHDPVPGQPAS
jgi:predicted nucleic acid-binding protein